MSYGSICLLTGGLVLLEDTSFWRACLTGKYILLEVVRTAHAHNNKLRFI